MKRAILLDGNAIVHRAFHALPPLTSPDGKPTNAVYGFVSILLKIIQELKPDYILATFDLAGPTFRHTAFERYKATRVKAPDELYEQFPLVKEVLRTLTIPIYEKEGYEADDIIGTAAATLEKKNKDLEIIIVTGDLDTLQLVTKRTKVYTMRKGISDTVLYDEAGVRERFGFGPDRVADYKGLRGDPSDNIPGVRGIGEKTATDLITRYGSIDSIYKNIKKIKPDGVKKKLEEQKEEAYFSKELATINTRVPVDIVLKSAEWRGDVKENQELRKIFERLGFFSLLKRLSMESAPRASVSIATKKETAKQSAQKNGWIEVSDERGARELLAKLEYAKRSAWGVFAEQETLFSDGAEEACFAALESGEVYRIQNSRIVLPILKTVLEDPAHGKSVFDLKKFTLVLRRLGITFKGGAFDVILAKYLLSAHERAYDVASIMAEYGFKYAQPPDIVRHLFAIEKAMLKKLADAKLLDIFKNIELPLTPILAEMEFLGVAIDVRGLKTVSVEVERRLEELIQKIYTLAGEEFNISSPQQVAGILFKKLNLGEKGLRKTRGGAQSTQASELLKLQGKHPIVDFILEYRELQKLKTTYIDTLPTLVDQRDGRIHTTYNQTGTVTGRLSSSNPNLQNIPTRTELGKKVQRSFVASPGYVFCAFDYSQMQLRIAAHMSGDPKMIDAFRRGVDIHTMTAAEVNNIPMDMVTSELRREAKTLNFGVLYGMGARAFAESAGIPRDKAKKFIDEYFEDFAGLRTFLDSLKDQARHTGYVETLFGRRRYIPELKSPYILLRLEGERMAINMPIQGTEADIMKLAMIEIYKDIVLKNPEEIRPVLQVHDEIIFEVKKGQEKQYTSRIKGIMEGVVKLSVPVIVDLHIAENWADLKG